MRIMQVLSSLTGRSAPPAERRKHERRPAHERAVVCWKDHLGLPKAHPITIVNVSIGGVAFSSPDRFPPGQSVTIVTSDRSLDCIVRHVRKTSRGYYLGAEISAVSPGDRAMTAIRSLTEAPVTPASGDGV